MSRVVRACGGRVIWLVLAELVGGDMAYNIRRIHGDFVLVV